MANGMLGVSGLFIPVKAMWIFLGLAWLAIGILGGRWASVWLRFRGTRVITCPENTRPAGVRRCTTCGCQPTEGYSYPAPLGLLALAGTAGLRSGLPGPD